MLDHVHVAGVQDIRSAVLGDLEILTGALFLDEVILPAAGLGALAAVCVPAGQIIRQQAAPGERHAHRPVDKGFKPQLLRGVCAYLADILKQSLAREHDGVRPEVIERVRRGAVYNAELRADMQLHARGVFLRHGDDAHVGNDDRVDARSVEHL